MHLSTLLSIWTSTGHCIKCFGEFRDEWDYKPFTSQSQSLLLYLLLILMLYTHEPHHTQCTLIPNLSFDSYKFWRRLFFLWECLSFPFCLLKSFTQLWCHYLWEDSSASLVTFNHCHSIFHDPILAGITFYCILIDQSLPANWGVL